MIARHILAAALVALPTAAGAQGTSAIEARLEKVEADLAIRRVLVDYAAFLDGRDYASYVGLFTPDGEWRNSAGSNKGREAIGAMLSRTLGPAGAENKSNYHIITNPQVNVTGNTATAVSRYLFVMRAADGTPRPSLAGIYRDELVRQTDGSWKISLRVADNVMPTPEEWGKIMAAQPKK